MLKEVILNLSSQNLVQYEHIVIDGNSIDGTKEFLNSINNDRLKFISEPDKSIYDALNKGLALCSNDVIGLLHSDDLYADENVLADISKLFESGADVVYADLVYVDRFDTSKILRKWKSGQFHRNDLIFGWMPPHPTFFFRRELLPQIGFYSLEYGIAADYEHMLRFLTKEGLNVMYLPRVITKMRLGGVSNKSLKNIIKKTTQDYKIASKFFPFALGTVLFKNLRKIAQFQISYFK